ncbi:hypothetical protein D9V41_08135 [Aeromicrobium phragmitis]|uniref:Uncharacterized protein n=1 Tax=Aeromicrobium phragmitis TaxID=2478914 RepID=A0A3L8PN00_9ACTN|nr:hypothetical protein [Aeromicrobium phragmitis]RLV55868.1 hypothetical protein D9V41_08135 [Aeromicrobium phragmitis]
MRRQAELDRVRRRRWAWTSLTADAAAVFLGLIAAVSSGNPTAVATVLGVIAVVVLAWRLLRWATIWRATGNDLGHWRDVHRAPGAPAPDPNVPPDVATVDDVRHAPDFESRAPVLLRRQYAAVLPLRAGMMAVLSGVLLGIALLGIVGIARAEGVVDRVVAGAIVVLSTALMGARIGVLCSESWQEQQRLNRLRTELDVLARQSGQARPVAGLAAAAVVLAVGVVALLVRRIQDSGLVPLLIAVALIVVAAMVALPFVLRRRRLHVVALRPPGDSLVDAPDRYVEVELNGDVITLRDHAGLAAPFELRRDHVVETFPVSLHWPLAPPAIAMVLHDKSVIVLAGRKVHEALPQHWAQPDRR